MKKSVHVSDGVELRMSSAELYQRLLAMALVSGPPLLSVFSFELAAVSPALFNDDGSMRKCQKSTLAKFLLDTYHKEDAHGHTTEAGTVIDGCALLQQLPWPKIGSILDVCRAYIDSVLNKSVPHYPLCVVFDSYQTSTTKEPEQKRRKLQKVSAPNFAVKNMTPVPPDKSSFLANKHNKQALIDLLANHLEADEIIVEHAGEEGDADVIVAKQAIQMAENTEQVVVMADDTDVLVLLLHHSKPNTNIFMKTKKHLISINDCKQALGAEMCRLLPFVHAMSGCDTTSAMFGMGKVKHFKLLQASDTLKTSASTFGDLSASKDTIAAAGEQFVSSLYSHVNEKRHLDELRYLFAISTKFVPVERMPPTSRACYFHSLRVHRQVSTWLQFKTVLDKHEYGFQTVNSIVTPVITDKCAAPENLLKEINCSCSTSSRLCTNCSCSKKRIPCSIHCKCKGFCSNPSPVLNADMDDD